MKSERGEGDGYFEVEINIFKKWGWGRISSVVKYIHPCHVWFSSTIQQEADRLLVTLCSGDHEGSPTKLIANVNITTC